MSGGLSHKIIAYLGRTPNFLTEIVLSDGEIETWKATDKVKPTMEQLNALQSEADKIEKNMVAIGKRKRQYRKISDQLDLLYKDMEADKGNKTGEWFKFVKKVKHDNPKEE